MRVIAGTFKGRRIVAPSGSATRPTSDRVREALFSSLESRLGGLEGETVLDAFAGSGALGIEALSRGARSATFVESTSAALSALNKNIDALNIARAVRVVRGDVFVRTQRGSLPGAPFTLLFLDPPYRINKSEVRALIERVSEAGLLSPGAHIVWEHPTETDADWPHGCTELGSHRYGSTTVSIAVCDVEGEGR